MTAAISTEHTTTTSPVAADGDLARWWSRQVRDYLRVRRSLGFKLAWDEHLLDRYTAELAGRGVEVLSVVDALAWSLRLPDGQTHRPLTRAPARLTAIRGFATYLHSLDPAHQIPPRDLFQIRGEVTVDQVRRTRRGRVGNRCAETLSATRTDQALGSHQSFHGAPRDLHALAAKLTPDLACTVDLTVVLVDTMYLQDEFDVPQRSRRRRTTAGGVVRRRSDLQFLADRLDSERLLVGVDEPH
jgi:hypothetical protein